MAQTASDHPAAGGDLDIDGLLFRIGAGRVVNSGATAPRPSSATRRSPTAHVATVDQMLLQGAEVSVTSVPEPATIAMLAGLGLVGVAARHRAAA